MSGRFEAGGLTRGLIICLGILGLCVLAAVLAFHRPTEGPLYQGKTINAWASHLLAPGPETREQATTVLKSLGTNAVPGLIKLLESHDAIWRKKMWEWALRLPPRLGRGLVRNSPVPQDSAVHQEAAMALAIIGPGARAAVPALGRALLYKEPENIWYFADALGAIGGDSLPALTNALANSNPSIRSAAISGLTKLGPAAAPAIPRLMAELKDGRADVRDLAVRALWAIGPPAFPALARAIEQDRGLMRQGAARALMYDGVPRRLVEPVLLGMLSDEDAVSREQAIATLAAMRAREEPVILAIAAALKDPIPQVRVAAAKGLGDVSWKAQSAVPALIESLQDDSPAVRSNAAMALGMVGPAAKAAEPALSRLAGDADASVCAAAKEALLKIQTEQSR